MRDFLFSGLVIFIAVVLYLFLQNVSFLFPFLLNVFSIVVIYFAVEKGEVFGAFTGMACGLIQDSFCLGVFGVAGIAKTLLGYFTGLISKKINIVPFPRNILFNIIMLIFELLVWIFIYTLIVGEKLYTANGLLFLQPFCTALAVCFTIVLVRKVRERKSKYIR